MNATEPNHDLATRMLAHIAHIHRQTIVEQSPVKALNLVLQALLDLMRPAVQADGGDLVLIRADVEEGVVEVESQWTARKREELGIYPTVKSPPFAAR